MPYVCIMIDGRPFYVTEAIARGIALLCESAESNEPAALAIAYDGQVRCAHAYADLPGERSYSAIADVLDTLDHLHAPVPRRLQPFAWRQECAF